MKHALTNACHREASDLRATSKKLPMSKRIAQSRKAEAEKSMVTMDVASSSGPRGADAVTVVLGPVVPAALCNTSCSTTCCNEAIERVARELIEDILAQCACFFIGRERRLPLRSRCKVRLSRSCHRRTMLCTDKASQSSPRTSHRFVIRP